MGNRRAAQCAAPTALRGTRPKPDGRVTDPPLRRTQKPVLLLVGAGHWPARRPRTSYHLLGKARRGCGTAPTTILEQPGPSGPDWTAESHSDFARRKFSTDLQVRVPRNGGPGVSRHWRTKFASAASPGDPQGELPRRGKRRWPGPLGTFPSLGKYLAPQGETLLQQTKGLYHCPLIRPLRGHLSLSPLSLRDISP